MWRDRRLLWLALSVLLLAGASAATNAARLSSQADERRARRAGVASQRPRHRQRTEAGRGCAAPLGRHVGDRPQSDSPDTLPPRRHGQATASLRGRHAHEDDCRDPRRCPRSCGGCRRRSRPPTARTRTAAARGDRRHRPQGGRGRSRRTSRPVRVGPCRRPARPDRGGACRPPPQPPSPDSPGRLGPKRRTPARRRRTWGSRSRSRSVEKDGHRRLAVFSQQQDRRSGKAPRWRTRDPRPARFPGVHARRAPPRPRPPSPRATEPPAQVPASRRGRRCGDRGSARPAREASDEGVGSRRAVHPPPMPCRTRIRPVRPAGPCARPGCAGSGRTQWYRSR